MTRSSFAKRSGITVYHQLYTTLSQQLDDGTFAAGARLPSEPELTVRYGVSRTTVRRAFGRLEKEGRILRLPGSGTYARATKKPVDEETYVKLVQDLRSLSRMTRVRWHHYAMVPTPPHILSRHTAFGPRALLIKRTRSFRGRPFVQSTHYIPERYASLVPRRKLGNHATIVVMHDAGVSARYAEQVVTATAADNREAANLQVPPGRPLLAIKRFVFTAANEVIEYQEALYNPELYGLRMRITAQDVAHGGMRWVPDGDLLARINGRAGKANGGSRPRKG